MYLDTSVWLLSITAQPGHEVTDAIFRAAADGRIDLAASWMVRAEIQTIAATEVSRQVKDDIALLLEADAISWSGLDRFVAESAVELSNSLPRRLSGADAVHLATAVRMGCDYFMALDGKFPYGDTVGGVDARLPGVVWEEYIFDDL